MIHVEVQGNLGNQLFQYAFARQIQEVTGQTICLNLFNFNKGRPDLKYSLEDFVLNENIIIERNKELPFYANSYSSFARIVKKFIPKQYLNLLKKKGIIMWQGEEHIGSVRTGLKDYYLAGWFQNPKYVDTIKTILQREFTPRHASLEANKELLRSITTTESVCISIRRGDYISNEKFKKKYYVCDPEYFAEAIRKIQEIIPDAVFVFFSDDIEWVIKNIKINCDAYYESGNDPVWEKLRLMTACKHYIISNSSFSWWAQYLGRKDSTIVIAPSRWGGQINGTTPIYQDDWLLIEV